MYLEAQVHILRNSAVILQAAKELRWTDAQHTPQSENQVENERDTALVQQIAHRLDVSRVPRTPIVEIRYSDPDPKRSAAFVNAIMHAYVDQNFKTKYESAMQV